MPVPWELFVWILSVYASYRFVRTLVALTWAVLVYRVIPRFRQPNLKQYEPRWTVVSGGTDGIGKAYVFELASRGLWKFILIGRNQDKLNAVKEELERNNEACRVKTYLFDFYNGDYQALRNYLTDVDIGFVVNSVGVGRKYLERYGDNPEADSGVLKVNALGSAEFMSMVLRPMERHGGGQIVVLSSSQGYRPIPYLASYCASKSLVSFLSESIDREYDSIRVQCLTPALVATNMTYYKNGSLFVVTPDAFVREAVSTIGVATTTSGCFNHEIQMLLRHLFPWRILKHLVMPIYWRHQKRLLKLHGEHNQ